MRRILVCTGVLGGGTAIVFALAALTAIAFPQGATVATQWGAGVMFEKGGPVAVPMPVEREVITDDAVPPPALPDAVP